MNFKKTVIVGSGLSALLMARMIKQYRNPGADIIIIEKDENIGGQFGSFKYDEHGCFDIGMHIYYETCVPEIDSLYTDLLEEKDWHILEDNYKDVAGLFVNGKLQTGTPYIDLRNLPDEQWRKYVAEIFLTIKKKNIVNKLATGINAYELLKHHFGKVITDEVFVPVFEKLYLTHPANLAEIATNLTAVNRVALFDGEVMLDLMQSADIRSRICYPDQLALPRCRNNNQRGFYPKEFGMFRVLERLRKLLEKDGVKFLTSSSILELKTDKSNIHTITIKNKNAENEIFSVNEIFWTAGLPSLAKSLSINTSDLVNDKKNTEGMYVNFLFDKMPAMDKLYYFYCFDKGYRSFRVTNYSGYCPSAAAANRGYPVCVEFWAQESDIKTEESITTLALNELKSFGVINDSYTLLFSKVEKLAGGGFPLPSVKNIENMAVLNERIKNTGITNLIATGVLTEKNVFFLKDVLIDTFKKVIQDKSKSDDLNRMISKPLYNWAV